MFADGFPYTTDEYFNHQVNWFNEVGNNMEPKLEVVFFPQSMQQLTLKIMHSNIYH